LASQIQWVSFFFFFSLGTKIQAYKVQHLLLLVTWGRLKRFFLLQAWHLVWKVLGADFNFCTNRNALILSWILALTHSVKVGLGFRVYEIVLMKSNKFFLMYFWGLLTCQIMSSCSSLPLFHDHSFISNP
jgi:hypothetical protein